MPHTFVTSAPGKVILSGEHAVVYGTRAIATVIEMRTIGTFTLEPADSPKDITFIVRYNHETLRHTWSYDSLMELKRLLFDIIIKDYNLTNDEDVYKLTNDTDTLKKFCVLLVDHFDQLIPAAILKVPLDNEQGALSMDKDSLNRDIEILPTKVFIFLFLFFLRRPIDALKVSIRSDLPMGAGLGSSASLCSVIATGVHHLNRLNISPENHHSTDLTLEDLRIINHWAFQGEYLINGNPSGVDNTCCVYGGVIVYRKHIPATDTQNEITPELRILPAGSIPSGIPFLITNTRQEKSTRALVANVATLRKSHPTVVNTIIDSISNITDTIVDTVLKYITSHIPPGTDLSTIASIAPLESHIEQQCTQTVYNDFASLFPINHSLLDALGVGHPKLTAVVSASFPLKYATKLTGAGGGGCAITAFPPHTTIDAQQLFAKSLENSNNFHCYTTTMGQGGVRIESEQY